MFKRLNNQKGFTLVEFVLSIVISGIVLGVSSQVILSQLNSYEFISNRQETLSDARYALNRMSNELIQLETADIVTISPNQIDFIDQNNNLTSFRMAPLNGDQALYRGNELMLVPIQGFQLTYLDENNSPTGLTAMVRQIEISVTTQARGTEGNLSLTTRVIPRNFIYANYQ